jgi:hypothetical protein
MDEKLEPVDTNSGRKKTRAARPRKNPEASQPGSPSPASRKKSGRPRQSPSDNSRNGTRKVPRRKHASGPRPLQDWPDVVRTGARKPSKRKSASGPGSPQGPSDDVRSDRPTLFEHEAASGPQAQSSSEDVRGDMLTLPEHDAAPGPQLQTPPDNALGGLSPWPERKSARAISLGAILLVAGLAAFLARPSDDGDDRGESSPVTTATVADGKLVESSKPQTTIPACDNGSCSSAETTLAVPGHRLDEAPFVGPLQSGDKRAQPAARARSNMAPGIVMSRKTGARARVGVAHAARFQAYLDDLETNHGARILFIGGIRPGHCASSSLHPCGKALDVCQLSRGVVDSRCHLPPRRKLAQIASSHGLFEGGRWCDSDYGHAQLGATAGDCGDRRTHIARRRIAPQGHDAFAAFR